MPTYNPWTDAAQSFSNTGNQMNQMVLGLARDRYMKDQRQQQAQAQMLEALSQMALRKEQEKMYQAQAGRDVAATDIDRAKLDSSNRAGTSAWTRQMLDPSAIENPEGTINMAQMLDQVVRNIGLNGRLDSLMQPHNIQQDADAIVPLTGQRFTGPRSPVPDLVLGNNEAWIDRNTGQPKAYGPVELSKDAQMLMPTTTNGVPSYVGGVRNNEPAGNPNSPMDIEALLKGFASGQSYMSSVAPIPSARTNELSTQIGQLMNQIIPAIQQRVPGQQQATNAPTQRPIGTRATTAKGTFEWTGTGWKPVVN